MTVFVFVSVQRSPGGNGTDDASSRLPVASESTRMLPSSSRGFSSRDSLRGVQFLHKWTLLC